MRRLKLIIILPVLQLLLAIILVRLAGPAGQDSPTARLVSWGLNAPALLFRLLPNWRPLSIWLPGSIFGIDRSDFFFLAGVVVTWYVIGRGLDQRHISKVPQPGLAAHLSFYMLVLGVGIFLGLAGINAFQSHLGDLSFDEYIALLMFLWAGILILLSGRALVQAIRRAASA